MRHQHRDSRGRQHVAGRAAEEIIFNDFSTGAADDLQKASEMARRIVAEFGMGRALGPMVVPVDRSFFLAQSQQHFETTSEATAHAIDSEIKRTLQQSYDGIRALLSEKNRRAARTRATT